MRRRGRGVSGGGSGSKEEAKATKEAAVADSASFLSRALGSEQLLASAPGRLVAIAFALTLGWPAYLCFNVSGRPTFPKEGPWPNHFAPSSPIFTSKRERVEVAASDAALGLVAAGLFALSKTFGFSGLFFLYFAPLLVVNAWLVTITLLQHPTFSKITPSMIKAAPSQRIGILGSPKTNTPIAKVPTAPIEVHTA